MLMAEKIVDLVLATISYQSNSVVFGISLEQNFPEEGPHFSS
jgi:hypothetical protein